MCFYLSRNKFHPRTGHENIDREEGYSATFSLASALHAVGRQRQAAAVVPPGKRPGTCYTGFYVGLRTGMDGCLKSRPHRNSIPSPSSLQQVAIPIMLFRPTFAIYEYTSLKVCYGRIEVVK